MAISKLNGALWASLGKINGTESTNIDNINSIVAPSSALPVQTGDLWNWVDPSSATVGDTTVPDSTYLTYGPYSAYDNYNEGINGSSIVDLSGTKCFYVDGVNDYVFTRNARIGTTDIWPASADYTTYTIEIWIRSNGSWISNGNIMNIGYNTATRARIDSSARIWTYPKVAKTTTGTLSTNTWHHIVWTMTPNPLNANQYGTLVVYKNGSALQTFTSINQDPSYSQAVQFFGAYNSRSERQRMYFGLQRRYGIALTAAEVLSNYNLNKADYGY